MAALTCGSVLHLVRGGPLARPHRLTHCIHTKRSALQEQHVHIDNDIKINLHLVQIFTKFNVRIRSQQPLLFRGEKLHLLKFKKNAQRHYYRYGLVFGRSRLLGANAWLLARDCCAAKACTSLITCAHFQAGIVVMMMFTVKQIIMN